MVTLEKRLTKSGVMEAMVLYSMKYDSIIMDLESGREYESRTHTYLKLDPGHQKKTSPRGLETKNNP
jgi:hypothetical protein